MEIVCVDSKLFIAKVVLIIQWGYQRIRFIIEINTTPLEKLKKSLYQMRNSLVFQSVIHGSFRT